MPLYFITGNAGKFREVSTLLPDIEQLELEVDEIQSLDPQVVIEHKLDQAAAAHDGEFIVDDTSLIFNCMAPLPGPFIKWFLKSLGTSGMADLVSRYPNHTATARVTLGYRDLDGVTHFFSSEMEGEIVAPRGENGFGWDAMFIAQGQTKSNAQLTSNEKNAISARGKATQMLAKHLAKANQA